MTPHLTHYTSNGQEIRVGIEVPVITRSDTIKFSVVAVCDEVPDRWHGEVQLGRHVILRTESVVGEHMAAKRAEQLLVERVAEVFTDGRRANAASGS